MAFWGVEVKPGKPITHSFDRVRGRLRITQATLGIGSSTKKSIVQCNIGDRSPVLLCALLPDNTESCHLEMEFEEANEVVFSVIGPRSVHLVGYYVGNCQHSNLNDDTDSYGEDIANTETEESNHCSDEDDYEDSFIDDDHLEIFPPSPILNGGVDEEMLDNKKPKDRKGSCKRLKKKYQSIESDDDTGSRQQNIVNGSRGIPESEDEDQFMVSSIFMSGTTAKNSISEAEEKTDKETVEIGNKNTEDDSTYVIESKGKADAVVIDGDPEKEVDLPHNSLLPSGEVGPKNQTEPKKKRKELSKEGKTYEADAFKEAQQNEAKTYNIGQDLSASNGQDQKPATDKGFHQPYNSLLPSSELGPENGMKPKKKRKERSKEVKTIEADSGNHGNSLEEDNGQHIEAAADNMDQDLLVRSEYIQKPTTNMGINLSYNSLPLSTEVGSENGPKLKKRKKEQPVEGKSLEGNSANCSNVLKEDKTKQDEVKADNMSKDMPTRVELDQKVAHKSMDMNYDQLADRYQHEEKKSKKKKKKKSKPQENADAKSSQVRTLSNGLIIEELETGKTDGKIAAPGRKVKVHYIGTLKENGQIFDSNIGKAPFKFCLGDEEVIEGWNVGLDGMRVGDKRRLIIPPSMGYGSQGAGENIPPNSWLVYDVELVGIR